MPERSSINPNAILVVVTSLPNKEVAQDLGRALVEQGLAACVQIINGMQSIYRWNGKLCEDQEVLLSAKTLERNWSEILSFIQKNHPYDLPEILAFSPEKYSQQYGDWVKVEINTA